MVSGGLYCTSSTCGMLEGINHKILIDLCSVLHCDANVNAMWHVMLWLPLCLFQLLQVRLLSRPEAIHRCPALRDSAEERSLANVAARSSSISKVLRVFRLLSILECNINLEPKTTIYKWMFLVISKHFLSFTKIFFIKSNWNYHFFHLAVSGGDLRAPIWLSGPEIGKEPKIIGKNEKCVFFSKL